MSQRPRILRLSAALLLTGTLMTTAGCGDATVAVRVTFPDAELRADTNRVAVWVFEVGTDGPTCDDLMRGNISPTDPGLPIVGSVEILLPMAESRNLTSVPFRDVVVFAEAYDMSNSLQMVGCTAFDNTRGTDSVDVDLFMLGGCREMMDGDGCFDTLFCTSGDTCSGGVCIPGDPPCGGPCLDTNCDETADTCDAMSLPDGTDCTGSDFCIVSGTCMAGTCQGTPLDCNAMAPPCMEGVCNSVDEQCDFSPVPDGMSCDDAEACTMGESCMGGLCSGGSWSCGSPPMARFTVSPGAGDTSTLFTFDATDSSDAEDLPGALTFSWDLDGDGTGDDTGAMITATFSTDGVHPVTVTATDSDGDSDHFTGYVVVTAPAPGPIVVDTPNDVVAFDGFTSLREAVDQANMQPGAVITFSGPMTIMLGSQLPTLTTGGTTIVGGAGVVIDGTSLVGPFGETDCFRIDSTGNTLLHLEIRNCPDEGVDIDFGDMNWVAFSHIHDNGGSGIVAGPGTAGEFGPHLEVHGNVVAGLDIGADLTLIHDNVIYGNMDSGICFSAIPFDPSGFSIVGNIIYDNNDGVEIPGNVGGSKVIWHNTVVANSSRGVEFQGMGDFDNADVVNNIFAFNGSAGLRLSRGMGGALDFNLYFANMTDCDRCTPGPNALLVDPMFRDTASDDYRIVSTSPAVDSGTVLTVDTNGARPGMFDGAAPDRGAFEHP